MTRNIYMFVSRIMFFLRGEYSFTYHVRLTHPNQTITSLLSWMLSSMITAEFSDSKT